MKLFRRLAWAGAAAGLFYGAASYLAARRLAARLISPTGLGPALDRSSQLHDALSQAASVVAELRHAGSARSPAELFATFASPGEPATRPTILFLHGKGGAASEWEPDALRALRLGWNVLLPDLRGHGASGGEFFTMGLLEREDLDDLIADVRDRFSIDPARIAIHACSAGSSVALQFAADRTDLRAVWLESPFGQSREMAQHYLSRVTRIPAPLLWLATEWAVARAVAHIRREIGAPRGADGLERIDPVAAALRAALPRRAGARRRGPAGPRSVHGAARGGAAARERRVARPAAPATAITTTSPRRRRATIYERRWEEFFRTYLEA